MYVIHEIRSFFKNPYCATFAVNAQSQMIPMSLISSDIVISRKPVLFVGFTLA